MNLKRLRRWWRSLRYFRYYIIADPADNSVTFSRKLFGHIAKTYAPQVSVECPHSEAAGNPRVYVFAISRWNTYGFVVNPDLPQKTTLADIQYNEKYKTIGFEALCPTVNRILYDYGLPADRKVKLTVTIRRLPGRKFFYNIERP